MNLPHFSNSAVPIDRRQLEQLLESMAAMQNLTAQIAATLLDKLDDIDGDPDVELNGDETDSSQCEDDHPLIGTGALRPGIWGGGPGCSISDPDSAVDDSPCDADTEDGI